jgi:hypothetical protein
MLKTVIMLAVALTVTSLSASKAEAATRWSSIASGCVLDSRYASNAEVNAQDGSVSFKSGVTGYILLTCAVTVPFSGPGNCGYYLGVTAKDSTAGGWIAMALYSAARSTGGFTTITSFNAPVSASVVQTLQSFGHSFNFDTNYYLVHVNMYRTSTSDNQVFYGTSISEASPC